MDEYPSATLISVDTRTFMPLPVDVKTAANFLYATPESQNPLVAEHGERSGIGQFRQSHCAARAGELNFGRLPLRDGVCSKEVR
jgi:hypothetical protein